MNVIVAYLTTLPIIDQKRQEEGKIGGKYSAKSLKQQQKNPP